MNSKQPQLRSHYQNSFSRNAFRLSLILVIGICLQTSLRAQTRQYDLNDLYKMDAFEKNTDADALITFDIGESKFNHSDHGFELYFTRKFRIKIFNENGLKYAKLNIPIYLSNRNIEELLSFKAKTYNYEGQNNVTTVETTKKDFYKEVINDNWQNLKVAISGAKAGSVIDVEYTVTSPFLFNLRDWEFQKNIPVIYSQYSVNMIPFYTYDYIVIGTSSFDDFKTSDSHVNRNFGGVDFKDKRYSFIMRDLPAFTDDDFISSPSDYKVKIDFQLALVQRLDGTKNEIISTWEDISEKLLSHSDFGRYIRKCKRISKKALEQLAENKKPTPNAIINFIKTNYNWDGNNGMLAQKSRKEFSKDKTGNVGNLNLLLIAMLREAGYKAQPVILSTRKHGRIYADYPFMHFFNYVIVLAKIDGKNVLVDATEKYTTIDQLPQRAINDIGMIVQEEKTNWVEIKAGGRSTKDKKYFLKFNESMDSINCVFNYYADSYDALNTRESYNNDSTEFLKNISNRVFDEILESRRISPKETRNFMFKSIGNIKPEFVANYYSIKPFPDIASLENPFKKDKRTLPIDMVYSRERSFTSAFTVPPNATIVSLPSEKIVDNELFSINYTVKKEESNIYIFGKYILKKPEYEAKDYIKLQQFMDIVIETFNQKIEIKI